MALETHLTAICQGSLPDARQKAGHKPTHGRYTKAAIAERREFRAMLRLLRVLIDGAV